MSEVIGIARFKFHPGKLDEYKRLSEEAMEVVRAKEPGTIGYEIFLSDELRQNLVGGPVQPFRRLMTM